MEFSKKNLFFIIITICFFLVFSFAKAQEIEYPTQFGQAPTKALPDYVSYVYMFAGGSAGFLAMIMLVVGGIGLITAVGDPKKIYDARRRILGAITGLILILFSYSIIAIINPDLLVLKDPNVIKPPPPAESFEQMIDRIRREILKGSTSAPQSGSPGITQFKSVYDYGKSVDCYLDTDTETKYLINGTDTEAGGDGSNNKFFCCTIKDSGDEDPQPSCQKLCEIDNGCSRVEGEGNCDGASQALNSCAQLKAANSTTNCEENRIYCTD